MVQGLDPREKNVRQEQEEDCKHRTALVKLVGVHHQCFVLVRSEPRCESERTWNVGMVCCIWTSSHAHEG